MENKLISTAAQQPYEKLDPQTKRKPSQVVRFSKAHILEIGNKRTKDDFCDKEEDSKHSVKLEKDRESVDELANFLRTNDPPPHNYMSFPESTQPAQQKKTLAFRIFSRQKVKEVSALGLGLLRLPDSAVAAKTIHGHRHIAISIPLKYDHIEAHSPLEDAAVQEPRTKSSKVTAQCQRTVLNPAMHHIRSPTCGKGKAVDYNEDDSNHLLTGQKLSTVPHVLDPEIMETMRSYYRREKIREQYYSSPPTTKVVQPSQSKPKQADEAIKPIYLKDLMQEAGRITSSQVMTKGDVDVSEEPAFLRSTSATGNEALLGTPSRPSVLHTMSISDNTKSEVSLANVKIADAGHSRGPLDMVRPQISLVRKPPPITSSAPTRELPALPEGRNDARTNCGQPIGLNSIRLLQKLPDQNGVPRDASHVGSVVPDIKRRQNRRDRTKALISRDISAYQQALAAKEALVDSNTTPAMTSDQATRQAFCRLALNKEYTATPNSGNTMTPIMLVAELEPFPDRFRTNDPNSIRQARKPRQIKRSNTNRSTFRSHTPPRSVTPSLASSDEEDVHDPYLRTPPRSPSYRRKPPNGPRQEAENI